MKKNLLVKNSNNAIRQIEYSFESKSIIHLHPLMFSEVIEDGYRTVVRLDTDESIRIDDDYTKVLKVLRKPQVIGEVVVASGKSQTDIIEFVSILVDNHFVKQIDDYVLMDISETVKPWFPHIDLTWLAGIFNLRVYVILIACCSAVIALCIYYTGLIPSYQSFFWHPDIFISFGSATIFGFFIAIVHEAAHFITTLAVGGKARVNFVKNRSLFWVYETESYYLTAKTRPERIAVYIAGMVSDLFQIALVYMFLAYLIASGNSSSVLKDVALLYILTAFLGILWQSNVYVKTDMFNLIEDLLHQGNLYEDTKWYLTHKLMVSRNFLLHKAYVVAKPFINPVVIQDEADKLSEMSYADKLLIRRYSIFVLIGIVISTVFFVTITLRRDLQFLLFSLNNIRIYIPQFMVGEIVKELVVVVFVLLSYLFLILSFYRSLRQAKMKNNLLTRRKNS